MVDIEWQQFLQFIYNYGSYLFIVHLIAVVIDKLPGDFQAIVGIADKL